MKKTYVTPKSINSDDVKRLRTNLGMTQKEFAAFCNVSKPTVERWEMSDKDISGPITLLEQIVRLHPEVADEITLPERVYPLRLWYFYQNTVCTIIDVDIVNQRVAIKNYNNNMMYRAFGRNEHPTFADYEEFLRSRCFPEERDKMKLMLRELDPLMIIEKTEGRMAEDDFWIRIDR